MRNDEGRSTNDEGMTNVECRTRDNLMLSIVAYRSAKAFFCGAKDNSDS